MESPCAEAEEQQYRSMFTPMQVQKYMYLSGKKMAEVDVDQDTLTGYFPEQILFIAVTSQEECVCSS